MTTAAIFVVELVSATLKFGMPAVVLTLPPDQLGVLVAVVARTPPI